MNLPGHREMKPNVPKRRSTEGGHKNVRAHHLRLSRLEIDLEIRHSFKSTSPSDPPPLPPPTPVID